MHIVILLNTFIISAIQFIVFEATSLLGQSLSSSSSSSSEDIEGICRALITFHLSDFVDDLAFNLLQDQPHDVDETTFRTFFTIVLTNNGMEAVLAPLGAECTLRTKTEKADFVVGFRVNATAEGALVLAETEKSKLSDRGKDILCMGINYRHDTGAARERLICNWVANLYHRNGTLRDSLPRREIVYWKPIDVRRESVYTRYETLETLGVGVSSRVVRCRKIETGDIFAAKIIRKPTHLHVLEKRIRREIHIMNQLHHPNLLHLLDTFEDDEEFVLIVEYLPGGRLSERGWVSESEAVNYVRQICDAVKYLHERNIFHCDLTRDNIVCRTEDCNEVVLVDFGESLEHDLALKRQKIPSTECREHCKFGKSKRIFYNEFVKRDDMLSIGVIASFLLTGEYPPKNSINFDHSFRNISEGGKDFVKRLLIWDSDSCN